MEYTDRERSPTLYTLQREKSATRSFLPARARPRPTLASHVTVADNCIPFAQGVAALVTRRFPPFLYVWPRETTSHWECSSSIVPNEVTDDVTSLLSQQKMFKVAELGVASSPGPGKFSEHFKGTS